MKIFAPKIINTTHTQNTIAAMGIVPQSNPVSYAGRLAFFLTNWALVTKDRWVLNTVKGYCIDFHTHPNQPNKPQAPQFNQSQQELLKREVESLVTKGAIKELHFPPEGGYFSNLFLVPKKDGGQRPVIN